MKASHISLFAKLCLLLATLIWGSTFFIMEGTIQNIGIFSLLALRFTIAALILFVILIKKLHLIFMV